MKNNILRFVAPANQAKRLSDYLFAKGNFSIKGLEIEAISMLAFKQICQKKDISFEIISIDQFLEHQPSNGISLLLDVDIEPIVYSQFWTKSPNIDGVGVVRKIFDKYLMYKIVSSVLEVLQPKTLPVRNRTDLKRVLDGIKTEKIVLKPRFNGYSSHNVMIMDRSRFSTVIENDVFNLCDYIAQEYLPGTYWPPIEWRLHFVGRKFCRCLKIKDKNNWSKNFKIKDINLLTLPSVLMESSEKVANLISSNNSKDNFCIDFLETSQGFLFLEANCGALESFYISKINDYQKIVPIIDALFDIKSISARKNQ